MRPVTEMEVMDLHQGSRILLTDEDTNFVGLKTVHAITQSEEFPRSRMIFDIVLDGGAKLCLHGLTKVYVG